MDGKTTYLSRPLCAQAPVSWSTFYDFLLLGTPFYLSLSSWSTLAFSLVLGSNSICPRSPLGMHISSHDLTWRTAYISAPPPPTCTKLFSNPVCHLILPHKPLEVGGHHWGWTNASVRSTEQSVGHIDRCPHWTGLHWPGAVSWCVLKCVSL